LIEIEVCDCFVDAEEWVFEKDFLAGAFIKACELKIHFCSADFIKACE
jgi:hypothetical protein